MKYHPRIRGAMKRMHLTPAMIVADRWGNGPRRGERKCHASELVIQHILDDKPVAPWVLQEVCRYLGIDGPKSAVWGKA